MLLIRLLVLGFERGHIPDVSRFIYIFFILCNDETFLSVALGLEIVIQPCTFAYDVICILSLIVFGIEVFIA